jgi:hypothetical protein
VVPDGLHGGSRSLNEKCRGRGPSTGWLAALERSRIQQSAIGGRTRSVRTRDSCIILSAL